MNERAGISGYLQVDGRRVAIHMGDTIASCLMRAGVVGLRRSLGGQVRGVYCAIGVCHECLVMVDGVANIRACQVAADPELQVTTMPGQG